MRVTDKTSTDPMSSRSRQNLPTGTSPKRSTHCGFTSRIIFSGSATNKPPNNSRKPEVASAITGTFTSLRKAKTSSRSSGSSPPTQTTKPFQWSRKKYTKSLTSKFSFAASNGANVCATGRLTSPSSSETFTCHGAVPDHPSNTEAPRASTSSQPST